MLISLLFQLHKFPFVAIGESKTCDNFLTLERTRSGERGGASKGIVRYCNDIFCWPLSCLHSRLSGRVGLGSAGDAIEELAQGARAISLSGRLSRSPAPRALHHSNTCT